MQQNPNQPPYYPQQPMYPPPRKPSALKTFLGLPLPIKIIVGMVAAFLVIFVGSAAIAGILSGGSQPATNTPTAVVAQATNTSPPKPTATFTPSGPRPITDATFGGLKDAFQAKFGDPIASSNNVLFQYRLTGPDGKPAIVVIQLRDESTRDGKDHAVTITLNPIANSGNSWNDSTAETAAKQFLPKDATFITDRQIPNLGLYHIYVSPNLGATFKDDSFTDFEGHMVTLGTFWLTCGVGDLGGCTFQLGDIK